MKVLLRRWTPLVLGVALVVAVVPGPRSATAGVMAVKQAKACALLTPAEIQQVLGVKVGSGKQKSGTADSRRTTETACDWLIPGQGGAGVSVVVRRHRTAVAARRGYERLLRGYAAIDQTATPVAGEGDAAAFLAPYSREDGTVSPSHFLVRKGRAVLDTSLFPPYDPSLDDSAKLLTNYQKLMGFALPRL